jgi:alkylation response protein AidB-like acyl-CoA dehydrogenase
MMRDALSRALSEPVAGGRSHWTVMAEDLGLCGLGIDEALGGLGGEAGHVWAVMETQGGSVVHTPFLSAMVLGVGVLNHAGGPAADALLQRIAEGGARVAVAYLEPERRNAAAPLTARIAADGTLSGRKVGVLDADGADVLVVSALEADGGVSLIAVPAGARGVGILAGDTLDGGRWGDVSFDAVAVSPGMRIGEAGQAMPALERAIDDAVVAVCAEAVGAMNAMLERTVDYVKQRRQFGRAIGEFQVVQHRLVDMLIATEQAASLARVARDKLAGPALDRMEAVSGAKVLIADACRTVAQSAVQLHGGIGTTEELDLSIFFRRALLAESLFGDASFHLSRYENLSRQKMERDIISGPMGQSDEGVTL